MRDTQKSDLLNTGLVLQKLLQLLGNSVSFVEQETEASDCLVLGNTRIKRSWLKQQLRNCAAKIIILDCPASKTQHSTCLQEWIEDLQIELHTGQCLIGCTSSVEEPERFVQTLLEMLKASSLDDGLSAAGAISKLQVSFAHSNIPLSVWLSATRGIIEIIPANNDDITQKASHGLDIGVGTAIAKLKIALFIQIISPLLSIRYYWRTLHPLI